MDRDVPPELLNRLIALYQQGQLEQVVTLGLALAQQYRSAPILYTLIGAAQAGLGQSAAAAAAFGHAAALEPNSAEAHNNHASALKEAGQLDAAAQAYGRALRLAPGMVQAHYNLGLVCHEQGRFADAAASQARALASEPGFALAHDARGLALQELERLDEAARDFEQAIALAPDSAQARYHLAVLRELQGRLPEALAAYEQALAIAPELDGARAEKLHLQAHMADWRGFAEFAPLAATLGLESEAVTPFALLTYDDDPLRQRARAERYVAATIRQTPLAFPNPPPAADGRLRIGYFSADFQEHATMYLMAGVFRLHDRARFAVHAYSYGPPRGGSMRDDLAAHVAHLHDVHALGDGALADLARSHGLDVAIDLKGHTAQARLGPFALRLAPVQIAYLGYPGTSGAPFIDYVIGDAVVIPPTACGAYSEQVITLPDCYQVNEPLRPLAAPLPSRAELGLPERGPEGEGFVFCAFNSIYKITPDVFAIWMRLLAATDGAVLWLLRTNRWAEANLRKAAQAHGIDPARLVFAERVSHAENLARHAAADLFLDCFAVGAHTTASDALRCGLPLVTMAGRSFAARVAASLLTSAGLTDLIAPTPEAYEAMALVLAHDPERLAAVRARLQTALPSAPLFDTEATTRHLEAAYLAAHARHRAGLRPAPISVS